ncbi:hypothetical protein QBC34DRAFT_443872 [Podospora aff. communis PSN243]|uniref:NAD(P)-binding protein n=1 Tax=Podospora aff. communis PSN243 TaxID=3040156 RepID=A0AAV9G636_9PEZI|nr:hypothetical protein QBC34DRAFT_443872 [Podospora aff. communis PSN243]
MAYSSTLTYLGLLASISVIAALIDFVLPYLRPSTLHRYARPNKSGQPAWAFVTGASDGIGKVLCHELASAGFNVILHGRSPSKLTYVANSLSTTFPSRTFKTVVADATICTETALQNITNAIQDLHLTTLINNAGGTPVAAPNGDIFKCLHEYTHAEVTNTINLNVAFPTLLYNALLPVMMKNGEAGVIINIGSLTAEGYPLLAPYSAGKGYLGSLSTALGHEMQMARYDVEVICMPLGAVTGVQAIWKEESLFMPGARTAARKILARVGCGRAEVVPHWPHAVQRAVMGAMPRGLRGVVETLFQIERHGLQHWGFTLYRTDYNPAHEERWTRLVEQIGHSTFENIFSKPFGMPKKPLPVPVTKIRQELWEAFNPDVRSDEEIYARARLGCTAHDAYRGGAEWGVFLTEEGEKDSFKLRQFYVFLVADEEVLTTGWTKGSEKMPQFYWGWMKMALGVSFSHLWAGMDVHEQMCDIAPPTETGMHDKVYDGAGL